MDRSSDSHIACDSAQTNNALEDNNPPPSDEHPSSSSMSPDSKPPTEEKQSVVFKVPFTNPALKLVKQVKGVSLPDTRTDTGVKCDVEDKINKEENTGAEHPNLKKSPLEAPEVSSSSVPYKVPEWSGLPSKPYSFEVLKGGVILETIFLSSRPFTVCGRHSSCDVVMEHPSISRYHAIIQYRAEADDNKTVGFYLFDLESTHGTQLNKCPVRPNSYYRVHVGHMIKFGGSSRTYILQGPPEDSEEESELTVTEIKERRKQEEEHQLRLQEQANAKRDKEDEDEGIDWGMG